MLFSNKKGMEMWQLVIMIIAVLFFLFVLVWYGLLNNELSTLFSKFGELG